MFNLKGFFKRTAKFIKRLFVPVKKVRKISVKLEPEVFDLDTGKRVNIVGLNPDIKYKFKYKSGRSRTAKPFKYLKATYHLQKTLISGVPDKFTIPIVDGWVVNSLEDNLNIQQIVKFLSTTKRRISLILTIFLHYEIKGGDFAGKYIEEREIILSRYSEDSVLVLTNIILMAADNQQVKISTGVVEYDLNATAIRFRADFELKRFVTFKKKAKE